MKAIPQNEKLPSWISEYVPTELVDSTLFRFDIQSQVIDGLVCRACSLKHIEAVSVCTCGSKEFDRSYRRIKVDMLPDLDLDYEILPDQMQAIPATYAFWAAIYSEIKLKVAIEERRLKAVRGKLTTTIGRKLAEDGVKLNAEQIKTVIEADAEVVKADLQLQQTQMQCGKLYHMLQGLQLKAELARSLFGMKRQELDRYSN